MKNLKELNKKIQEFNRLPEYHHFFLVKDSSAYLIEKQGPDFFCLYLDHDLAPMADVNTETLARIYVNEINCKDLKWLY